MSIIWTPEGPYRRVGYDNEADLESAIVTVQDQLFGANRIYLDVKKKIGGRGGVANVPDGYLIDLSGQTPRLFVVENELAAHDPLRHIAVQILQFSLSFEAEPLAVKKILLAALNGQPAAKARCEAYGAKNAFRNLDHLMERLVFETPFAALVIIDEVPENLEIVLARRFQFGVEVLRLARYRNDAGECVYEFEPFLADLAEDLEPKTRIELADTSDLDTIVVPARDDGFQEIFLGQNRWHAVRIHGSMRPQIRYLAVYRVAPTSAIGVRLRVEREHQRNAARLETRQLRQQRRTIRDGPDAVEFRFERRGASLFDGGGIHAGGVGVADLLIHRAAAGPLGSRVLQYSEQHFFVAIAHLREAGEARPVGRQRIAGDPATAGVLIEIDARVGRLVHGRRVQAARRDRPIRRQGKQGYAQKRQNKQEFHDDSHEKPILAHRDETRCDGTLHLMPQYDALLIVSFGGPERSEDVIPFLENVLRGRPVPRERMLAVAEHYYHFGGRSPINEYCRGLMAALACELPLPVYWGNRNWHPLLADTMRQMASAGVRRALAIATSAYAGYSGCRQYLEDIAAARQRVGLEAPAVDKLPPFCGHPLFIEANAARLEDALGQVAPEQRAATRLVFTAHSIPLAMAATCKYEQQLRDTAGAVARRVGRGDWDLVWQSRSGPARQPWLEPDIRDHLRALAAAGVCGVVVAPIGFLSDHMEVLYDLDVEASALARELGLGFVRAGSAGLHPAMLRMFRELVLERLAAPEAAQCAADCCPPPGSGNEPGGLNRSPNS
jgi:ferrochelatase